MLHNRGVVSVLFILDELLNPMCWNDYSLKNKQKSTFSCKSQKVTWKVGKSSEGRGFSSVSVSVSYSSEVHCVFVTDRRGSDTKQPAGG